jgi:hypothetical protein
MLQQDSTTVHEAPHRVTLWVLHTLIKDHKTIVATPTAHQKLSVQCACDSAASACSNRKTVHCCSSAAAACDTTPEQCSSSRSAAEGCQVGITPEAAPRLAKLGYCCFICAAAAKAQLLSAAWHHPLLLCLSLSCSAVDGLQLRHGAAAAPLVQQLRCSAAVPQTAEQAAGASVAQQQPRQHC